MAPRFRIVAGPGIPEKFDYVIISEGSNWDFAPQSECLETLTKYQQGLYEQIRAQGWSDERCYFYFTNLDVYVGFRREYVRYKGWTEEKIQQWDNECQRTNLLAALQEGLDSEEQKRALR